MERKKVLYSVVTVIACVITLIYCLSEFIKCCLPDEPAPQEIVMIQETEARASAVTVKVTDVSELVVKTELEEQTPQEEEAQTVSETTTETVQEVEETERTEAVQEETEITDSQPTEQNSEEPMYTNISAEDITWLEMITRAEAGICGEEARQGVAATVLARAKMKNMSIYDVIFESGQFTPAIGGKIYLIYTAEDGRTVYEEVTPESAKCCESAVLKAIQEGGGKIAEALGQEPIYFYAPSGLSDEEAAKRESISNKYETDGLIFYTIWD